MEYTRRLSDKIILAHTQACDEGRLDVATALLRALEIEQTVVGGQMTDKRQSTVLLDEAYQRQERAEEQAKTRGKH